MKVVFLLGKFPVLSQTFILNQITGLIDRGHEVDIYALEGKIAKTQVHPNVERYRLLERTYYLPDIPKNASASITKSLKLLLGNFHKAPLVWLRLLSTFNYIKPIESLQLLYALIPLLDRGQYDIIHCQFGIYGLTGVALRNLGIFKGKIITSFRGYDISQYIQQYGDDFYNPLFAQGDLFLSNCEYFKRRVVNLGCDEQKVIVHGSGIDCSRFSFTPRQLPADGKVRIATTGRLVEKKGIEYSIRAVAQLAQVYDNIEYNIIGGGPLWKQLQQLIQDLQIEHVVKLLGWKTQQEIVEILNNSQIFVAPSITAEDGNQDAPVNTLKEAMAMGLPVIGTLHGGIPELVEEGISGFLVPERDPEAIAEKLSYLIAHPEIWSQMGEAGRTRVEANYDMNKLNDELVAIYQQLLSRDAPKQLPPEQPLVLKPT